MYILFSEVALGDGCTDLPGVCSDPNAVCGGSQTCVCANTHYNNSGVCTQSKCLIVLLIIKYTRFQM